MESYPKYPGIYLAENLVDYFDQTGIVRLSFPRCFIWFEENSTRVSYDDFIKNVAHINWLDPNDGSSEEEREAALIEMWNFLCEEEEKEDMLCGEEW